MMCIGREVERSERPRDAPSYSRLRVGFWLLGTVLAVIEAWSSRYFVTPDAVAYTDMSDGVLGSQDWHRLINGVWSPLYPALLGFLRRIFSPSAIHEIRFDHILNVPIFLFAFASFEFLLSSIHPGDFGSPFSRDRVPLPRWVFLTLGYALFLWASISEITLETLRPDMLMSGFLYLAAALLIHMRRRRANLGFYVALGVVLGLGFLAKAPMLPIAMLILAASLLIVENRLRAIPMAACSGAIFWLIASLYFIPLSRSLGYFTLGESSRFNYIVHVNHAGPGWYLQSAGNAEGTPVHRTHQIFAEPPTYEFSNGISITHPLRFDPSYWSQGLKPVVDLHNQLKTVMENLRVYRHIFIKLAGMILGLVILCYADRIGSSLVRDLIEGWALWLVGVAGVLMYALIHVEARYVGAFFVLLWLGLAAGLGHRRTDGKLIGATTIAIALSLILPAVKTAYGLGRGGRNMDGEVAQALPQFGIQTGEQVARISTGGDIGWARASRVTIIAEVDWETGARKFWNSTPAIQTQVLQALRATGAKCVIAHLWGDVTPPGWQRLGKTQYWIYQFRN